MKIKFRKSELQGKAFSFLSGGGRAWTKHSTSAKLSESSYPYTGFLFYLMASLTFRIPLWPFSSVQFSRSVMSDSVTPWTAARQASLSIINSRSLLKLGSIESVMPYNHLIFCRPLLLLPSILPSTRVFSNESALHLRWPKYVRFFISTSNEYLELNSFRINWWSPSCPGDSQQSSPTPQFESINSLVLSLLYGPTLTSVHDY